MIPAERYLASVLQACDELGDQHTNPEAWEQYQAKLNAAKVVLAAEKVLDAESKV